MQALRLAAVFAVAAIHPTVSIAAPLTGFTETTLVTSAKDSDLVNPWGISFSATSPFWISDNGTGKATLYNSAGVKQGLVVSMPVGSEPITGQVFNGTGSFNSDLFLFASENGTIAGWRGALGTTAEQLFSVAGASYKGLAINNAKDTLFAADFVTGAIDAFSSSGLTGSFLDPTLPAGFAPFNIQNLGIDDAPGPGNGFVDRFDPVTHTFTRVISNGPLNSPWGIALAPAGFGAAGGALLVGNFGDGLINAFHTDGAFIGTLADTSGAALMNDGLWTLTFGNGGNGGSPGSLYITAGPNDESAGIFARIDAPEPATLLYSLGGLALLLVRRRAARS